MNSHIEKYLSIEELLSLPTFSDTTISEDGQNIAFVKQTADWKANTYQHHIWIYEKRKDPCFRIDEGASPSWSPDSRQLAYLHSVNKKNQIYVKSLDGSPAVQMTDEGEGITHFKWSPNGQGFYYLAQSKESEENKTRRESYGDFHRVGRDYQNHCLYYIEINDSSRKAQPLTDGQEFHILEYDLSKDGKKWFY